MAKHFLRTENRDETDKSQEDDRISDGNLVVRISAAKRLKKILNKLDFYSPHQNAKADDKVD